MVVKHVDILSKAILEPTRSETQSKMYFNKYLSMQEGGGALKQICHSGQIV